MDITYGPSGQRCKTVLKKNGTVTKTVIFAGDYEKVTDNGVTQQLYYISGGDGLAAVYVKQTGQSDKIYYTHTDYLGSIVSMTDGNGTEVFKASYDAWGKQTITNSTFKFHRGYTGHEHLPEFGLINMNGRMYDPIVGRFLSPDPYVQMPDFSQSFNRYSYCINNPLIYADPSGEIVWLIPALIVVGKGALIGAAIGGGIYTVSTAMMPGGISQNWNLSDFGHSVAVGAVAGAVTSGMGLIAPSFNVYSTGFAANLPTYLSKAAYTGLTAATATGASMMTSDFIKYGRLETSGNDYFKAMGVSALTAGLMSFGSSIHQYATLDRYTYEQQAAILSRRYNTNVVYSPDQGSVGKWTGDFKDGFGVSLNRDAFSSQSYARHITEHELKHISNLGVKFEQDIFKYAWNNRNTPGVMDTYINYNEIKTHNYGLNTASNHYLSARDWFGEYKLIRDVYGYNGRTPNGLKWYMMLFNFR